jgi:SAM-dependent methyltransferase
MYRFPIKRDVSGRALLNLACGTRTEWDWNNLDFSPYATLRRHPVLAGALYTLGLVSGQRISRLHAIDPDIVRWNLARGIPFNDNTFDVVYHSHFLEHLTRDAAVKFLAECYRVLKSGGILRIVVPDLELLLRTYLGSLDSIETQSPKANALHEEAIAGLFDQMVRSASTGTSEQKGVSRWIEKLVRGDALKTGEVHRWMYDRHSLARLLHSLGFADVVSHEALTSQIEGWAQCQLDANADGSPYKPESLYLEARKPGDLKAMRLKETQGKSSAFPCHTQHQETAEPQILSRP